MKSAKMTLFAIFAVTMMTLSCSSDLTRDQRRVRRAAERCYSYLQKGKYEKFVGEIAYADSMSEDYRAQMVDLVKEFAASQEAQHGKLLEAEAIGDTIIDAMAQVYLLVSYADSTSEEVGLPMVKVDGDWKMQ